MYHFRKLPDETVNNDLNLDEHHYKRGGKVKKSKNKNKNKNKNVNVNTNKNSNVNVVIHNHLRGRGGRRNKSLAQQTNNLKQQATVRPFQPIVGYMSNPSPNNFNLQDLVSKLELLKEKGKVAETQAVRPEHVNTIDENEDAGSVSLTPKNQDQEQVSSSSSSSAMPYQTPQAGAQPVTAKNPTIRDQVVTLLLEAGLHGIVNNDSRQSINANRFDQWYSSNKAVFDGKSHPATTTATKFSRILQHQDYVRGLQNQPAQASASDLESDVGRVSKPKKLQFGGTV